MTTDNTLTPEDFVLSNYFDTSKTGLSQYSTSDSLNRIIAAAQARALIRIADTLERLVEMYYNRGPT